MSVSNPRQQQPSALATPYAQWAGLGPASGQTVTMVASRMWAVRFVPETNMLVTSIAFLVTTAAGANDNVDVAIMDSAGTVLVSSGSTASKVNATGPQAVTITGTTVLAGVEYFLAFAHSTLGGSAASLAASAAVTPSNSGLPAILSQSFTTTPTSSHSSWFKASVFPLVTTVLSTGAITTAVPALAARI